MKLTKLSGAKTSPIGWYLAALAPVAIAGCAGAFVGHFAVVTVALGIFVATLTLGRTPQAAGSASGTIVVADAKTVDRA